jgi:hypothetical protein
MGEMKYSYKVLVGKTAGKRPLGRPKRRCEDNITMDRRVIRWQVVDCIHLPASEQRPVAGSCERGTEISGSKKRRRISSLLNFC